MINKEITHQISIRECLTKYPHLNPNNIIEMYVQSIENQFISVGLLIDNNKVMTITIPIDYYNDYLTDNRENKINKLLQNGNI